MTANSSLLDVACPECGEFACVVRTGEESARCEKCGADLIATHFVVIPKRVEEEFFREDEGTTEHFADCDGEKPCSCEEMAE